MFRNEVDSTAFSVGGSTFVISGSSIAIGTTTVSARLHVFNGDIRISTTSGSRGIIFQDGSVQTSAYTSSAGTFTANGYVQLSSDSVVSNLSGSFTNTSFNGCTSGSTVTLNCYGAPIEIYYQGGFTDSGGNEVIAMGFLCNGAACGGWGFTTGLSGTAPYIAIHPSISHAVDMSWSRVVRGQSGPTNVCLWKYIGNNTWNFSSVNRFGARCVLTP